MPLELFVSLRATREIERANEWWVANRVSAPDALLDDLQVALTLLLVRPEVGVRVDQASSPGVRRNRLEVLSVWHSSRGSSPNV